MPRRKELDPSAVFTPANFRKPIRVVAQELGVCDSVMKNMARAYGLHRWPYRRLATLDRTIRCIKHDAGGIIAHGPLLEAITTLQEEQDELLNWKPKGGPRPVPRANRGRRSSPPPPPPPPPPSSLSPSISPSPQPPLLPPVELGLPDRLESLPSFNPPGVCLDRPILPFPYDPYHSYIPVTQPVDCWIPASFTSFTPFRTSHNP